MLLPAISDNQRITSGGEVRITTKIKIIDIDPIVKINEPDSERKTYSLCFIQSPKSFDNSFWLW